MRAISLSLFFPVYNERENLPLLLAETERVLAESPYIRDYEIILVDDGSKDGSSQLADAFANTDGHIVVVHHSENRGYGEALKTGIKAARMEYVFFTDADLQFDITELNALLAHLSTADVVLGYRAPRKDPFMRRVNAWGWNILNRVLFGLKVRDIDCAFKLFKRDIVQQVPIRAGGAMASAELLIRLSRHGVSIKEVPVSHLPRVRGSATGAKLSVIYRALGEMVALYRSELGAYGRETGGEAFKFMLVGAVNTAIDALAYIALTRGIPLFGEHLLVAKFLSFFAGTISSLLLNRTWTFGIRTKLSAGEVTRFYAMTSLSIVANVYAMNVFISLGMYDLYALAITTVVTFGINFTLSKFWVFRFAGKGKTKTGYATS